MLRSLHSSFYLLLLTTLMLLAGTVFAPRGVSTFDRALVLLVAGVNVSILLAQLAQKWRSSIAESPADLDGRRGS
jgi:hypothetical protein